MTNIIRYPLHGDAALDEHEAQFTDTDEGELIAGHKRLVLDSLTVPARPPMQPLDPNSIGLAMIAGTLLFIAVISVAALVWALL